MWLNSDFDRDAFHANSDYNRRLELSLFTRNPSLEFRHMLCASDLIWNPIEGCEIQHPQLEFLKGKYFWTGSYFPQYQENSFLPSLIEPVSAFLYRLDAIPLLSALFGVLPGFYIFRLFAQQFYACVLEIRGGCYPLLRFLGNLRSFYCSTVYRISAISIALS